MNLGTEKATYNWKIEMDFNSFELKCDVTEGLRYHTHVNWTDSVLASTSCGSTTSGPGGHYDPTLACAPASSMISECAQLQRTTANGFVYECNPSEFAAGNHYLCEVGDLSAKLGLIYPISFDSDSSSYEGSIEDPFPPMAINYKNKSGIATKWLSTVFHCPSDNLRLMCALFLPVPCDTSSSSDNDADQALDDGAIIAIVVVVVISALALFAGVCYYYFIVRHQKQEQGLLRSSELTSSSPSAAKLGNNNKY